MKNQKNLKIMYDQTQFMPIYLFDSGGIYMSDLSYKKMEKISGYAPDPWIVYTQLKPKSFWLGAYDKDALKKEAEIGFKNFKNKEFVKKFETFQNTAYDLTLDIKNIYFKDFFKKEKEAMRTKPYDVIAFLEKIYKVNSEIMGYFLLTQPQRFDIFEKKFNKFILTNNLELVAQNGRYLTYASKLRKTILNFVNEIQKSKLTFQEFSEKNPEKYHNAITMINKLGFLNWGFLGGDLINKDNIAREVNRLLKDKSGFQKEKEQIDKMEKNIEKRDRILLKNKKEEYRIADIMGHSAVIRFDLQTLVLCTLNYVKQFLDQIPAVCNIERHILDAYEFPEIIALIKTGKKVDDELIRKRQNGYLKIFTKNAIKVRVADMAHKEIKDFLEFRKKEIETTLSLKGIVASWPNKEEYIFRGRAFVLTTAFGSEEKVKELKEREILVVTQTHPQIVFAMEKALVIVADEGGVTSHAAIVSRELNKPCITGTKLGTKIFKTGDVIEINLKDGTIKKISL